MESRETQLYRAAMAFSQSSWIRSRDLSVRNALLARLVLEAKFSFMVAYNSSAKFYTRTTHLLTIRL